MERCKKCESEWNTKFTIDRCPFCGAVLYEEMALDPTSPPGVLRYIVDKYGRDVLSSRTAVSLFKDFAPDLRPDAELISIAIDAGVYADMLSFSSASVEDRKMKSLLCKERLKQKKFLADEYAEKPIGWLSEALGWEIQPNQVDNIGLGACSKAKKCEDEGSCSMPTAGNHHVDKESLSDPSQLDLLARSVIPAANPFRYADCKAVEEKNNHAFLSLTKPKSITIPSRYNTITETALKAVDSENLYIPSSIRHIHELAFVNASSKLKSIYISDKSKYYSVEKGNIREMSTGRQLPIPERLWVRTYTEK